MAVNDTWVRLTVFSKATTTQPNSVLFYPQLLFYSYFFHSPQLAATFLKVTVQPNTPLGHLDTNSAFYLYSEENNRKTEQEKKNTNLISKTFFRRKNPFRIA